METFFIRRALGEQGPRCPARRRSLRALLAPALVAAQVRSAWAGDPADPFEGDPLQSHQWPEMRKEFLGKGTVVFDNLVRINAPEYAEDAMNVPLQVSADPAAGVRRIMILVDRNPIRKVVSFEAFKARPSLALRFKLEQSSPVRAVAQTRDGRWHVSSALVNAAGGGCTVPGATRADGSWPQTLGQVSTQWIKREGDSARLRLRVMHPMDTGLVNGIPAFHIRELEIVDDAGQLYMRMQVHEPVSENPLFSIDFDAPPKGSLRIIGRDNNGNRFQAGVLR